MGLKTIQAASRKLDGSPARSDEERDGPEMGQGCVCATPVARWMESRVAGSTQRIVQSNEDGKHRGRKRGGLSGRYSPCLCIAVNYNVNTDTAIRTVGWR